MKIYVALVSSRVSVNAHMVVFMSLTNVHSIQMFGVIAVTIDSR